MNRRAIVVAVDALALLGFGGEAIMYDRSPAPTQGIVGGGKAWFGRT